MNIPLQQVFEKLLSGDAEPDANDKRVLAQALMQFFDDVHAIADRARQKEN